MKLFHGTYEKTVPIIKPGEFAMSGNNVFDGLFSSPERDIAASHGNPVFIYHVDDDKIAKSRDLDARFQEVYAFLHNELDTADVEEIADRVMWDNNSDMATSVLYAGRAGYTLFPTGYRLHTPEQNADE